MLDPEYMGADAFAASCEAIAITGEPPLPESHLVVAVVPLDTHLERLLPEKIESLRLRLVAVRLRDKTVQVGMHHGASAGPPKTLIAPV